jgi:hypothetical protein
MKHSHDSSINILPLEDAHHYISILRTINTINMGTMQTWEMGKELESINTKTWRLVWNYSFIQAITFTGLYVYNINNWQ